MNRVSLVTLVLANLGFVAITEAARPEGLLLLAGLTLLSPLLAPLAARFFFRALWNVAVIAVFGLLVRHVQQGGAAHLLEDGLLLASFCQVHLLNNLRSSQKPDLLFFNSFLIAVVTGFLSFDLGYCLVLFAYAPALVVAMELEARRRAGSGGGTARAVRGALGRATVLLLATFALFFVFPRDFQRRGLLGEALQRATAGAAKVDFNPKITLERPAAAGASDRIVFRASLRSGVRSDVPAYWRGATLDRFNGKEWSRGGRVVVQGPWRRAGRIRFVRDAEGARGATMRVEMERVGATRLFAPLSSAAVRVTEGGEGLLVQEEADLTLRCGKQERPLVYEVDLVRADRALASAPLREPGRDVATHLWVNSSTVPPLARQLALEVKERAGPAASPQEIVDQMRTMLMSRYRYLPVGASDGARDLQEFIHGGAGAHCEYFATALTLMLRIVAIPCRVVTGYRSEEWQESESDASILTVREKHAHAWVEVLDPVIGWYPVDATPPMDEVATSGSAWLLQRLRHWVTTSWEKVVGLSGKGHTHALDFARRNAWMLLPVAGALFALRLWRRRRAMEPRERHYRRVLSKSGLRPNRGETPRDLLERARGSGLPAERLVALECATREHERAAYGRTEMV